MKKLLVFLITLSVFAFLAVEMNFYSFIVLPILSLSLCLAIFQRNRLMPNLIFGSSVYMSVFDFYL
ncbi:hypothetical protein N9Y90_01785 [Flavobacteriales bacterium]|nr:hypothetical protein [Flavobacteriales bacterium]